MFWLNPRLIYILWRCCLMTGNCVMPLNELFENTKIHIGNGMLLALKM